MSKIIEFQAHSEYVKLKDEWPIPAKINIPAWYKKLSHEWDRQTVKGCMPFLDAFTTGYILKMPIDMAINHNFTNNKGEKDGAQGVPNTIKPNFSLNLNGKKPEYHQTFQLEGSPLIEKNANLNIHKIINPWIIKTPPGWSCLFVPCLNNNDDRFEIISGVVDTDIFDREINFPIVINSYKYPKLKTVIEKGTPYVQIIPFKRDSWKMKVKTIDEKEYHRSIFHYGLKFMNRYRSKYWNKKDFK